MAGPAKASCLPAFYAQSEDQSILLYIQQLIEIVLKKISITCPCTALFFQDLAGLVLLQQFISFSYHVTNWNFHGLSKFVTDYGFNLVKDLPFVKGTLEHEQEKLEKSFDKDLKIKSRAIGTALTALPDKGIPHDEILQLIDKTVKKENVVWEKGHLSGAVYGGQKDHIAFLNQCYSYYSIANPLHPDIWPSVMKFEAEIVAMTASLVNNGLETVCGCTSSGGTESIILAIKAHRDYYRSVYNVTEPEMIAGVSAHAAVDKACDMLGIKLIKVDLDSKTFRVNLQSVRKAIGPNTIMMYASAPQYPHGAIDNVKEMSKLAVKYKIGLHVDCCLGGFVLPFAKKLGFKIPDFDFSLPGVTSMSLDTHKYGYALKGTSVVLYRHRELRHAQYFCYADWTGGMYTTPTISGSRSGGLIAQTWASLVSIGTEGFLNYTKQIMDTARLIADGISKIDGIKLVGEVDAMVVCFTTEPSSGLNVYSVGDKMHAKGWSLNSLQHPACIHICVTVAHIGHHEEFIQDLEVSVHDVRKNPDNKTGNAAIYGMTSALPPGPVNEMLKVYNDVVLKL
eukprot:gene12895-14130_t